MGNEIKPSAGGLLGWIRGSIIAVGKSGAASETWKRISPWVIGGLGMIGTTIWGWAESYPALAVAVAAAFVFALLSGGAFLLNSFLWPSARAAVTPDVIPLKEALIAANERLRTKVSFRPLQTRPQAEIESHFMQLFRGIDDLRYLDRQGRPVAPGEVAFAAAYISPSELERAITILDGRSGNDGAAFDVAGSRNVITGCTVVGGGPAWMSLSGDENVASDNLFIDPKGGQDDPAPARLPDPPPTMEQDWNRLKDEESGRLSVDRDKGLPEALAYAIIGLWGQEFMQAISQGIPEAGNVWQEFRQRAHDKKLTVWGKRTPHGIWVKIDPEFWEHHQPEWFDLLKSIARTEPTTHGASSERFVDLMVSQTEFEKEWPHGR